MSTDIFNISELDQSMFSCSILPVSVHPCQTGLMALTTTTAPTQTITQRRRLNVVEEVEEGEGGVAPQLLVEVEGGELGRKERAPGGHQGRRHLEVWQKSYDSCSQGLTQ